MVLSEKCHYAVGDRNSQALTLPTWLEKYSCKDRWRATEEVLFVSPIYNGVWKDYIFSSKHSLSGPSDLPPFHSPAASVLQLTARSLLYQVLPPSSLFPLCVQLSCSSFFITTLGPGPSSSTNNAPDCCRPQKLFLYTVSKLWASPNSKGSCQLDDCCPWLCVWLQCWKLLTAPGAYIPGLAVLTCASLPTALLAECEPASLGCKLGQLKMGHFPFSGALAWGRKGQRWTYARCQ